MHREGKAGSSLPAVSDAAAKGLAARPAGFEGIELAGWTLHACVPLSGIVVPGTDGIGGHGRGGKNGANIYPVAAAMA
ncbi:MAG TPA: hypothetical protein VG936_01755 [Lacunisphaera sp.]|nr:hypothetical protein [Lacunisphaera sp.]